MRKLNHRELSVLSNICCSGQKKQNQDWSTVPLTGYRLLHFAIQLHPKSRWVCASSILLQGARVSFLGASARSHDLTVITSLLAPSLTLLCILLQSGRRSTAGATPAPVRWFIKDCEDIFFVLSPLTSLSWSPSLLRKCILICMQKPNIWDIQLWARLPVTTEQMMDCIHPALLQAQLSEACLSLVKTQA